MRLGIGEQNIAIWIPIWWKDRRRESIREWTPAFGQINQSATYLKNQHISEGDLFLFFGNFRHIKQSHGKYEYVRRTDKIEDTYLGMPLQVVWGYLQVGGIITDPDEQKKLFLASTCL